MLSEMYPSKRKRPKGMLQGNATGECSRYCFAPAPRDGSMLGYLSGTAWNFVNEPERRRVDLRAFVADYIESAQKK